MLQFPQLRETRSVNLTGVDTLILTGYDSNDNRLYGPVSRPMAETVEYRGVPDAVTRVLIDYVADGRSVGVTVSLVNMLASDVVTVTSPEDNGLQLLGITVTPSRPSIPLGFRQQLEATGSFEGGVLVPITSAVAWSSSDTNHATVSSGGEVTGLALGTSVITAQVGDEDLGDPVIAGSTLVTVTDADLASIAVTPADASVPAGDIVEYTATGTFTDGVKLDLTRQVTWTSSDRAVARFTAGPTTAGRAVTHDQGAVTVKATASTGVFGATSLTVTQATVVSLAVTPSFARFPINSTVQMRAIGTFSNGLVVDVTDSTTVEVDWTSGDPNTATVGSPNVGGTTPGLVTGVNAGYAPIYARVRGTFISASGQVEVISGKVVTSVVVSPSSPSLGLGQRAELTATANFSDGSQSDVTSHAKWSSSAPSVALVGPLAAPSLDAGEVQGQSAGSAQITAKYGGVTSSPDTVTVTAAPPTLVAVTVDPDTSHLAIGGTGTFTAVGEYSDGSTRPLPVNWSVEQTSAVISIPQQTVPETTVVATGQGEGAAILKALDPVTGKSGGANVAVVANPPTLLHISVAPASSEVSIRGSVTLTATATWSDGLPHDWTPVWVSQEPGIVSVSGKPGEYTAKAVGAAYGGPVTVTVQNGNDETPQGTATVKVNPGPTPTPTLCPSPSPSPSSITVSPGPTTTVAFAANLQFTATSNTGADLTGEVLWRSSNPAVATVDALGGLAFGMTPGKTTITAVWPGSTTSGSSTLTVSTPGSAPGSLPVEFVNDSDVSDGEVTFDGRSLTLTNFTNAGTWVSPFTGRTRQVYGMTVGNSSNGHLAVTYRQRSGFVEYTVPGDWDLTAINTFSVPLQIDVYNGADGAVGTRTVYHSTPTILQMVEDFDPGQMGPVLFGPTGVDDYDYQSDLSRYGNLQNFAEVWGPQQVVSAQNDDPAPWPSFSTYLDTVAALPLRADGSQFSIAYNQYGGYEFTGICESGAGGYTVTLNPVTAGYSQMVVALPLTDLDFFIYETPCGTGPGGVFPFTVDGVNGSCGTAYESAYDSFAAALNFGYLAGRYTDTVVTVAGQTMNSWYSHPPTSVPGGAARVTNDGRYNPWATIVYNVSDYYGFTYGDREGRLNPQLQVNANNAITPPASGATPTRKVRVTLLHDLRLDMPQPTVTATTDSTISLDWPDVDGACAYDVTWSPPFTTPGFKQVTDSSCTIDTGLNGGTPYTIWVRARGPAKFGPLPIRSYALPVVGVTIGTPPTTSGSVSFNVSLQWGVASPPPSTWTVNGSSASATLPIALTGAAGPPGQPTENVYLVSFTDYQGTVRKDLLVLMLEQVSGGGFTVTGIGTNGLPYGSGMGVPSSSFMPNNGRTVSAATSLTVGGTTSWPFSGSNVPTINLQYDPVPDKQFLPVVQPTP